MEYRERSFVPPGSSRRLTGYSPASALRDLIKAALDLVDHDGPSR